jgi:pantoate--beta-alanine ligase
MGTAAGLRAARSSLPGPVGLVPTMGYLHEGHLSLVRAAAGNASVVVSIFVNPTQFGPTEDLAAYPRDLERDLRLLSAEGVALVFAPAAEELYPLGSAGVTVDPGPLGERLEGAARPGHFRGVATVVAKLFGLVRPDSAYFGQKDAQQVVVIENLVRDLFLPVEVRACPTVREPDGLALSSRNVYLSPEERRAAPALYKGLRQARDLWAGGESSAEALRARVRSAVAPHPELRLEYVSVAHPRTLGELEAVGEDGALLSLAARAGRARLIDNVRLEGAIFSEGGG